MSNQLIHETSPYLKQHAENPVNWFTWDAATLQLAQAQNKPILLSIGYSACHWCHVMAHESFEDINVAAIMNEHFINIKVDREERPDLDHLYQTAHYMLTHRNGGWPLTMFLSANGTPFFGGTYFPKVASYNLPAFPELLERIAEVYCDQRDELTLQGQTLIAAMTASLPKINAIDVALNEQPLNLCVLGLVENFDSTHGGFGPAPKFLHPAKLNYLIQRSDSTKNSQADHIVNFTLQQMAYGGIYDQLGGGFFRYSVDERWDIPHFEKMLYDNGLLLGLYSDAWQKLKNPLFARVIEQTANWLIREMQSPEGGYYASLDADSEHEEGKYYVWHRNEIRELLNDIEFNFISEYYGLNEPANFENHSWNLKIAIPPIQLIKDLQLNATQATEILLSAQQKLFAARMQRTHPARDEKILGSWNGLTIAGMAKAARMFNRPEWLQSAQQAIDFIRLTLWINGKLLVSYKDGKAHLNAYLDDYAFLLNALLELMQTEFRTIDLLFATQLADALLNQFEDPNAGGFFFTSHDHESLIHRDKTGSDNATPSGNGIAAQALLRLTLITGDTKYAAAAERCLQLFFPTLLTSAAAYSSLCSALIETLYPPILLVLRGTQTKTQAWQKALREHYFPNLITISLTPEQTDLPSTLDKPSSEAMTAWICKGTQCLSAHTDLDGLLENLQLLSN